MTKQKSTKKALLGSILSLVICMTMLVGTTFAWFTDSVTSTGNKIQSGTLKVDLELLDKDTNKWNSLKESKAAIFNYDLWEPGYTDVKILKVENEGTLALKWMAKFVSEAKLTALANVIDVYVCPSEEALSYPDDRNLSGYKRVGTVADFVNTIEETTTGTLEAKEDAYLGIALKMQESAGNEYQGMSLGGEFDIQILATQLTSESDSFNNQYDKDATYIPAWDGETMTAPKQDENGVYHITNGAELAYINTILAGLEQEGSIQVSLDADINLGNEAWTPIGTGHDSGTAFSGTFDGNGYTIYNVNVEQSGATTYSLRTAGTPYAGLFGCAMYGWTTIKNLTVENISVEGMDCVGALVGYLNTGSIVNCHVINGTVNGSEKVGGIVGDMCSGTLSESSASNVTVIASSVEKGYAGGLAGRTRADGATPVLTNNTVTNATVAGAKANDFFVGTQIATVDLTTNEYENVTLAGYKAVEGSDDKSANSAALSEAINSQTDASIPTIINLGEGEYKLPSANNKNLIIVGTEDTVLDITDGSYMDSGSVAIEGATIKLGLGKVNGGKGSDYTALYSPNATFTNCTFEGGLRVGRNGAKFIDCTFNLGASDYVYTYGNHVDFTNCTFNSQGKALIVYSDGNGDISKVNVTGCTFNASAEGYAGVITNQSCAAVEIDNYGCGVELTLTDNVVGENFSGEWRIKTYYADRGNTVIVNGTEYTSIAIDGKTMTINNKEVTVIE